MMRKPFLSTTILLAILLSGCSDSETEAVNEQPITGAPAPTVAFSNTEYVAPDASIFTLTFTTQNAGSTAVYTVIENEYYTSEIKNGEIELTIVDVDMHSVITSIDVDVVFGGQKTTNSVVLNITNTSGLLLVQENNNLTTSLRGVGEEDLQLASAIKDVAAIENTDLSEELSLLKQAIVNKRSSADTISTISNTIESVSSYLNNEQDEAALRRDLTSQLNIFNSEGYLDITAKMLPFWQYLGDFTLSPVSDIYHSFSAQTYSRYINNPILGDTVEGVYTFHEDVSYLNILLPAIAGTSPCDVIEQEQSE